MFLVFNSFNEMKALFNERLRIREEGRIEYCTLKKYKDNKILFVAPHAFVGRKYVKNKKFYIGFGDKNTGRLAKLAAIYTNTAYIIPKIVRTEADPARSPEKLGKGIRLLAPLCESKSGKMTNRFSYIQIHKNKKFREELERFHSIIKRLDPRVLIFLHGMHRGRKFDVLLGFGSGYEGIGGKEKAFKFRKELVKRIEKIFQDFGINKKLKVGISNRLFPGKKNYLFKKHVRDYNKRYKYKRVGINVELNLRGRVSKDVNLPRKAYQLAVQALGDIFLT